MRWTTTVMPKTTRTTNKGVISERLLKHSVYDYSSRFEVEQKASCPFGHGRSSNDIIVSNTETKMRGSPSLVGRGIANPMSERTRGFELPVNGTKFPLPALFLL